MKKKLVSSLLVLTMMAGLFAGCGSKQTNVQGTETQSADQGEVVQKTAPPAMEEINDKALNIIDDNYRTCYELFVYSFCDSDGDGIGDLKGVTSKLDYIEELGCNEIWFMPIMPSTTYHKYDVIDYRDIDEQYGTMEDFEELVSECHARGINVVIDFVMNHSSSQNEWFKEASSYILSLEDGEEPNVNECPYVDYYHFQKENGSGYVQLGDSDWYYEAMFWSEMPDLNLDSEAVQNEFADIAKFWMDKGVDGFRLDAIGEYESGDPVASTRELGVFVDKVKTMNPDTYLVGECWKTYDQYSKFYESGIDSVFDFAFADYDGYIANVLNGNAKSGASTYGKAVTAVNESILEYTDSYIDAPFYTNHDMARSAGYYTGDYALEKTKMGHGMNMMMSGTAFIYYGEELGMRGSGKDENKRVGMYWTDDAEAEGMCDGPKDADEVEMSYPSLEEQKDDPMSIYSYVKQAIKLRNIYPEIARGTGVFLEALSDENICVIQKEYDGESITIVFNPTENESSVDLSSLGLTEIAGLLQTGEEAATFENGTATLPAYTILLLK